MLSDKLLEIATALERGIRVIPTLIQGASMPQSSTLPENLKSLARRNAIELSYSRFHTDVDKMIRAIERAIETASKDKFTSQRKSGEGEKLGELKVRQVGETLTEILAENLSVETMGGLATTVIEQGTPIPVRKSEIFSTGADNQTAVDIHLLRGVRPMAIDNISLGRFQLDGIPPAPRGIPQIEVTFDIDANGILKVSAKDKATGRIQNISGKRISDLSKQESERIRNEAKHFADEDQKRKQLIETRLTADSLVYQTEKTLKELGSKVPANERVKIEASISSLKQVAQTDDVFRIKQLTDEVQRAFHALSQQLYSRR
jgi:molecular chaperone DnaK (HSP70)